MTGYQTGNSGSHRRENIDMSPIRRQLSRGRAFVAPFCMPRKKLVGEIVAAEAILCNSTYAFLGYRRCTGIIIPR
jgi:hypothetical protein